MALSAVPGPDIASVFFPPRAPIAYEAVGLVTPCAPQWPLMLWSDGLPLSGLLLPSLLGFCVTCPESPSRFPHSHLCGSAQSLTVLGELHPPPSLCYGRDPACRGPLASRMQLVLCRCLSDLVTDFLPTPRLGQSLELRAVPSDPERPGSTHSPRAWGQAGSGGLCQPHGPPAWAESASGLLLAWLCDHPVPQPLLPPPGGCRVQSDPASGRHVWRWPDHHRLRHHHPQGCQ